MGILEGVKVSRLAVDSSTNDALVEADPQALLGMGYNCCMKVVVVEGI